MPKHLLGFIFLFLGFAVCAQHAAVAPTADKTDREIHLEFQARVNNQPLVLGNTFYIPQLGDSVTITKLKFYISDLYFSKSGKATSAATQRFFLIDVADSSSLQRNIKLPSQTDFNQIHFHVGIDSTTQMAGAQGGELDPTQGMYWTWQSGYINFKLEGNSRSCPARNNVFQFHIGGYQTPHNTLQNITLATKNTDSILVVLDLNPLLNTENISQHFEVMSPNQRAVDFAKTLPKIFSILP